MHLQRMLTACLMAGCAAEGTGILLTVESDGTLEQLRIGAADPGLARTLVPDEPSEVGAVETILVRLAGERDGMVFGIDVEGLRGAETVASGSGSATVERGDFVPLTVTLSSRCGDAQRDDDESCDDGNRVDADGCSAGCQIEPGFVCVGAVGERSECGRDCLPSCRVGEVCRSGNCECDPETCPGCCSLLGRCVAGDAAGECGLGGVGCTTCGADETCEGGACVDCADDCLCAGEVCDPIRSDQCLSGVECACGDGPECGPTERCTDGGCVCSGSCRDTAGICQPNDTLMNCGAAGGLCTSCDRFLADRCEDGACRCGDGPICRSGEDCESGQCFCNGGTPCEEGQRCQGNRCVCDFRSCSGCCNGATCLPGTTPEACGSGGVECVACDAGESCTGVECSP